MAAKDQFVVVEQPAEDIVVEAPPVTVGPSTRRVRVRGTWTQQYGLQRYDFVDGKVYDLPIDLADYLKSYNCTYEYA